jgi:hypothetical protein
LSFCWSSLLWQRQTPVELSHRDVPTLHVPPARSAPASIAQSAIRVRSLRCVFAIHRMERSLCCVEWGDCSHLNRCAKCQSKSGSQTCTTYSGCPGMNCPISTCTNARAGSHATSTQIVAEPAEIGEDRVWRMNYRFTNHSAKNLKNGRFDRPRRANSSHFSDRLTVGSKGGVSPVRCGKERMI